ncbi:hypothetical protein J6590_035486 [Homalodisca vitripennis]|nr:hypothetical protein J6590_035486 [Homalodisca vitripennis]
MSEKLSESSAEQTRPSGSRHHTSQFADDKVETVGGEVAALDVADVHQLRALVPAMELGHVLVVVGEGRGPVDGTVGGQIMSRG